MPLDRLKFAAQLRKQRRKIKGVEYNKALALDYFKAQKRIVDYITLLGLRYVHFLSDLGIVRDSLPTFTNYITLEHREHMAKLQDASATNAIQRIDKYHRERFISDFRDKAGIDLRKIVKEEKLNAEIAQRTRINVELITNANREQIDRVESAVNEAFLSGSNTASLESLVSDIGDDFESRAKLIARDQTNKFISELNKERQQNIGITSYYWRTTGDNAVRDTHAEMEGQLCYWDSPPAIGTIDGEPVNPGEDIQCRCVADPAIDQFLASLPDEE
jgi:SPP1 gp7 family putative phage head morphogenesis protein